MRLRGPHGYPTRNDDYPTASCVRQTPTAMQESRIYLIIIQPFVLSPSTSSGQAKSKHIEIMRLAPFDFAPAALGRFLLLQNCDPQGRGKCGFRRRHETRHFRLPSCACGLRNPCFDHKSSPHIHVRAFAAVPLTLLRLKVQGVHPCPPVRCFRSSSLAVALRACPGLDPGANGILRF